MCNRDINTSCAIIKFKEGLNGDIYDFNKIIIRGKKIYKLKFKNK